MQLKQFYYIATKVSSKKSATTFGDLPDCLKTVGMHFAASEKSKQNLINP